MRAKVKEAESESEKREEQRRVEKAKKRQEFCKLNEFVRNFPTL